MSSSPASVPAPPPHRRGKLIVAGTVRVPGDKSISHRALMLASIATGSAHVRGILNSADVMATWGALQELGVRLPPLTPEMHITGAGFRGLRTSPTELDCANSGTTARLMAGIVAGAGASGRFTGDASLSRRPMKRVAEPLRAMGAEFVFDNDEGLPFRVSGPVLRGMDHHTVTASAQVKSTVLLAGLLGGVPVSVTAPARSRDHTEIMLRARGVDVRESGGCVALVPADSLPAADVTVPGDLSSAAYFAALAALSDDGEILLPNVCLNPTRTGFLSVLRRMGARVETNIVSRSGEPWGDIRVGAGALHGASVTPEEVPSLIDELPLIACLATMADGETTVRGAAELRIKESDRIGALVANLVLLGADAAELPDGFRVTGCDAPLAGRVRTFGDHRLAMAFGVLASVPGNRIEIDDPACVGVSYPDFWNEIARVAG